MNSKGMRWALSPQRRSPLSSKWRIFEKRMLYPEGLRNFAQAGVGFFLCETKCSAECELQRIFIGCHLLVIVKTTEELRSLKNIWFTTRNTHVLNVRNAAYRGRNNIDNLCDANTRIEFCPVSGGVRARIVTSPRCAWLVYSGCSCSGLYQGIEECR